MNTVATTVVLARTIRRAWSASRPVIGLTRVAGVGASGVRATVGAAVVTNTAATRHVMMTPVRPLWMSRHNHGEVILLPSLLVVSLFRALHTHRSIATAAIELAATIPVAL